MSSNKNPERVASGYKATMRNPHVSDEAKQNAKRKLDEMGVDVNVAGSTHEAGNSRRSGSAKSPIGQASLDDEEDLIDLNDDDYDDEDDELDEVIDVPGELQRHDAIGSGSTVKARKDKNEGNVVGGYKATLKNPHTSHDAKVHAGELLGDHGVDLSEYDQEIKYL